MVLKSEGCESRANIGNIARVSQMSHECRKLRGASDELGSDMGDCLQLILTQYEPNGNCVPTPKLAKPLEFTGAKDSVDIETFLSQVTLNLAPYGNIPNVQKVGYLLSHFKGAAGKWAQVYIKRMDEGEFFAYNDMVEKINKMWGLVDKEGQAVRELEALRQGTTSVTDYIATFHQKAQYTQFSDYDLRLKFRSGLQTRIKAQLTHIP